MSIRGERVCRGSNGILKPFRAVAIRGEPRVRAVDVLPLGSWHTLEPLTPLP